MAWYRTGTVAVTNGSSTVTGSGTSWITGVGVGEAFYGPDGRVYEIANIISATSLTLGSAYLGSNQSGQSYQIVPTQSYIRDLAADAATLVAQYGTIASTVGAGKFTDGTVALPSISFTSDNDTGIRRAGINDMRLVASGADQANITASGLVVQDTKLNITGSSDATKIAKFEVDGFTTATTRTFTLPNANTTLVGTDTTQTLTNKTLNASSIGATTPSTGAFTTLTTTGNAGIGVASPGVRLDVSASTSGGVISQFTNTNAASLSGLRITSTAGADATKRVDVYYAPSDYTAIPSWASCGVIEAPAARGLVFSAHNGSDGMIFQTGNRAERLRIDSAGNTLIGQTASRGTVAARLQVHDSRIAITAAANGIMGSLSPASSASNSIAIDADPDNVAASSFMIFRVDGTERIRLTDSGNVGIGISSPAATLHTRGPSEGADTILATTASGSITLRPDGANGNVIRYGGGGANANVLRFLGTSDTERMRIDASGRMILEHTAALGASSGVTPRIQNLSSLPSNGGLLLQNATNDATAPAIYSTKTRGGTPGVYTTAVIGSDSLMFIGGEGSDGVAALRRGAYMEMRAEGTFTPTSAPALIAFGTSASGSTTPAERLRITSAGNVGIGTSSPAARLDVSSNVNTVIRMSSTKNDSSWDVDTDAYGKLEWYSADTSGDASVRAAIWALPGGSLGNNSQLTFDTKANTGSYPIERARIDSAGNVGIGTDAPQTRLDVSNGAAAGSLTIGADVNLNTRTDATRKIGRLVSPHFTNAEESFFVIGGDSDSTANTVDIGGGSSSLNAATVIRFLTAGTATTTTGSERLRIDSAGNVGIGTTAPTANLSFGASSSIIGTDTVDASDNKRLQLTGAGQPGVTRSAYMNLHGNEHASFAGQMSLFAGDAGATSVINFFTGNGVERMRIDNAGRVIVGSAGSALSTSAGGTALTPALQNTGTDAAGSSYLGARYSSDPNGPFVHLAKSRSTSTGAHAIVQNGDILGNISFAGADGAAMSEAAFIRGAVNGAPAAGSVPGALLFATTASGNAPTERMRIDSEGRLLINTSAASTINASAGLFAGVAPRFRLRDNATGAYNNLLLIDGASSGSAAVRRSGVVMKTGYGEGDTGESNKMAAVYVESVSANSSSTSMCFASANAERMRIDSSGNVGIGTSSPASPLHVVGGSASGTSYGVAVLTAGSSNTTGSGAKLYLSGTPTAPTTRAAMIEGVITGSTNAHSLLFYTNASGVDPAEQMRIDSSGNVGINATPSASVWSSVRSLSVGRQSNAIYGSTSDDELSFAANLIYTGSGAYNYGVTDTATLYRMVAGQHVWYRVPSGTGGASATPVEIFRTDSSGNVGIGTSSPTQRLTVDGNSSITGYYGFFANSAIPTSQAFIYRPIDQTLAFGTNSIERLRITSAGNVGIGVASPDSVLHANSATTYARIKVTNTTTGTGNLDGLDFIANGVDGAVWNREAGAIQFATNNTERLRIDSSGNTLQTQPAPAAVNATATLTVANLRTRIITSTTAAAVTGTLPTGTLMDGMYSAATDMGYDWSVINTGPNAFTVAQGTGHTVIGNMTVATNTTGMFRSRRTAANTWITYRIG